MPQAIAAVTYAVDFIATAVSNVVVSAAYSLGANAAVQTAIGSTVYYGTELALYAGLSAALQPRIPKPEGALVSIRQSVPPRRRGFGQFRASGPYALWEAVEDFALDVVAVHDGEIDSFVSFFLNDDPVTLVGDTVQTGVDGRYPSPQVKIQYRLGLATETAYSDLTARFPAWTSAHRGDGVASIFLSCQNGKAVHQNRNFPNGEPNVSAIIKAQKVFDPRDVTQDESDPTTWHWRENPALCLLTYLMYERGHAYDWSADEVATFNSAKWTRRFGNTLAYWTAAADVCDEVVARQDGFEVRYASGGQYTLDEDESAVVNTLITSMDGWLAADGKGGFVVYAGKFDPPSVTLTSAHIKSLSVEQGVALENQVNQIDIAFTDPGKNYNSAEADPWIDEAGIIASGKPRTERLELPWVQSYTQARRLAKRRMERHKAAYRGTMTVSLSAQAIFGQRFLEVEFSALLPTGTIIEITGNIDVDLSRMEATFPWISVDPDARDGWTPADDEGAAPPPVDPPSSAALDPPTIDSAAPWYVESGSGGSPRLILGVTGPDRVDLTWQSQWRVDGLDDWSPVESYDDITDHPSATLRTGYVTAGATIEVQVRYQTGGGLTSDWSASELVGTAVPTETADSAVITADSITFTADAAP